LVPGEVRANIFDIDPHVTAISDRVEYKIVGVREIKTQRRPVRGTLQSRFAIGIIGEAQFLGRALHIVTQESAEHTPRHDVGISVSVSMEAGGALPFICGKDGV
jgi:hypothetical protein